MGLELKAFDMVNGMTYIGLVKAPRPQPHPRRYSLIQPVVMPTARVYSQRQVKEHAEERRGLPELLRHIYYSAEREAHNLEVYARHVVALHDITERDGPAF